MNPEPKTLTWNAIVGERIAAGSFSCRWRLDYEFKTLCGGVDKETDIPKYRKSREAVFLIGDYRPRVRGSTD